MMKNENNPRPGCSKSDRAELARVLVDELFESEQTEIASESPSKIAKTDIVRILESVRLSLQSAEHWRLKSTEGSANPLAMVLRGRSVEVQLACPDGTLFHAKLTLAQSSINRDNGLLTPGKSSNPDLIAEDVYSLSASGGHEEEDEFHLEPWEESPTSAEGHLRLECRTWPSDRRLVDVLVSEKHGDEPLAVMTVQRAGFDYELRYDSDDLTLLESESVVVELRVIPTQGDRA